MPRTRPAFDHLVVLMMENRGFDHLMGYLYERDPPARFVPPHDPVFRGVAGRSDLGCWDSQDPPRFWPAHRAPWATVADMNVPFPDPGEAHTPHMHHQLFGVDEVDPDPARRPETPPMSGFVTDYVRVARRRAWAAGRKGVTDQALAEEIMRCYPPEATPVLSGLARAYAVSDAFFASVPSCTYPNRSFLHAADSSGWVDNEPYPRWSQNQATTIFQRLSDALPPGRDWAVFWDPQDRVPLTRLIHRPLYDHSFDNRFLDMEQFEARCAEGDLPAYSFVQPRILLNNNDMHPAYFAGQTTWSSVLGGERLIARVYDALRRGPAWERTFFVILFDEHGGTYDHAPPPAATPPHRAPPYPLEHGFRFDRLGCRVPAVFVSPYIEAGTVFRAEGPAPLEHCSVIRTLCEVFGLEPLTDRDRAAPDLLGVLTRDTPRRDAPAFTPRPCEALPDDQARRAPLIGLQRAILSLAAHREGRLTLDLERIGQALDLIF